MPWNTLSKISDWCPGETLCKANSLFWPSTEITTKHQTQPSGQAIISCLLHLPCYTCVIHLRDTPACCNCLMNLLLVPASCSCLPVHRCAMPAYTRLSYFLYDFVPSLLLCVPFCYPFLFPSLSFRFP